MEVNNEVALDHTCNGTILGDKKIETATATSVTSLILPAT